MAFELGHQSCFLLFYFSAWKAILVIKWQRNWLNCVLVFCEKLNLWVINLISKQKVEGVDWLLLTACGEMWEEWNKSKELLRLEDLENVQLLHTEKNEDICSKESAKGVDEQHMIRRLVWVWTVALISHLRRSLGQRWGYTSRNCQLVLNGTENIDQNSRRLSDLDSIGIENRAIPLRTCVIFQG